MFSRARIAQLVVLAVLTIGLASMASAQVNSGVQTITLNATLAESLTLSLSGNAVNFTLTPGSAANAGSTNITATTAWVLKPGRTAVGVYAYFTTTSALTDGAPGDIIPTTAFFIADNGGASTAVSGNAANTAGFGAAGAGLQLANVGITGANKNSSRTDAMAFNINLATGALPQLPAGTYTGTLNIQAQATP